jgi:hypothetical protein
MGLPPRIALPILAAVAVVFIALMGYLVTLGLGQGGTALGTGPVEQGDARIVATPAPAAIHTNPPGAFGVPQTGTGAAPASSALPGNEVGGGSH